MQVLDHLNEPMCCLIARQEMMFLSIGEANGARDNTLRAGPPGFVRVLDEHRIAWPEFRGNGLLSSLGDVIENAQVGLLFVDFTEDSVGLHVNGTVEIVDDPMIRYARQGQVCVVARVQEAYLHCAKHIPHLQKPDRPGGRRAGIPHQRKSDDFAPRLVS